MRFEKNDPVLAVAILHSEILREYKVALAFAPVLFQYRGVTRDYFFFKHQAVVGVNEANKVAQFYGRALWRATFEKVTITQADIKQVSVVGGVCHSKRYGDNPDAGNFKKIF